MHPSGNDCMDRYRLLRYLHFLHLRNLIEVGCRHMPRWKFQRHRCPRPTIPP